MATIDDYKKLEIKVGKILSAEKIEGSEKLLKLEVDFGEEKRQIVSGIAKAYEPEHLLGKEAVFITNLEPRVIMGLESQGMILAVSIDDLPVILAPEKEAPPGSIVK
jgi:methionine--tRNA ligase beta chain